ncbi:MAG: hypothetical protein K2X27_13140, partial [Candidatus Obscuribacterales bacterium]|nr:hypothetical protein [Candidatus Obscuribacterales bacterium]
PDRTLLAMGVSNICSSLIGGLTIIPGIIKSTTCIVSGGRTAWINFYNALFLIAFLALGASLINLIPLAALSAVLVHIGYKLAGPHKWKYVASVGKEQLLVFITTIFVTLQVDLLLGIFAGMLVKLLVVAFYACRTAIQKHESLPQSVRSIFKNPVAETCSKNGVYYVKLNAPLTCFNSLKLRAVLDQIPEHAQAVQVEIGPEVSLIDHSVSLYLQSLKGDLNRLGRKMEIKGAEALHSNSAEPTSFKYRETPRARLAAGF